MNPYLNWNQKSDQIKMYMYVQIYRANIVFKQIPNQLKSFNQMLSFWTIHIFLPSVLKPIWPVTRVNIKPENRVLIGHVRTNFATGKITRNLRVALAITQLANYFGLVKLNNTVTSDIKPEKKKC